MQLSLMGTIGGWIGGGYGLELTFRQTTLIIIRFSSRITG